MTTGRKKNLALVKPNNPLFVPPERSGLFHEDLTDTPPAGAFQSGLPEKAIEVPGPLVQQAIARAIAGLSESQAFQAMDTTQMAKVNRLAHGVPMDVVSETQVDAQGLLEADEKESASAKKKAPYAEPADHLEENPATESAGGSAPQSDSDETSANKAAHEARTAAPGAEGVDSEGGADTGKAASSSAEASSRELKAGADSDVTGEGADEVAGHGDPTNPTAPTNAQAAEAPAQEQEQAQAQAEASVDDQAQEPNQAAAGDDRAAGGDDAGAESSQSLESSADDLEAAESDVANHEPAVDPRQQEIENYPVPEGMQLVSREDLEALHSEAYESGRQAGLEESSSELETAVNAAKEAAYQEGYDKGYEEAYTKGEAAARDELQAEVELASQDLKDLTQKLQEAAKDTDQFYAPMLKLSMHLAEQLVRGELSASGKAIAHLVETSLAEFESDPNSPILVKLNPEDLERIKAYDTLLPKNAILKADPTMFVGSVRVQINGALIEDLIEQRSMALWQALTRGQDVGEPPPSFLKNLELMKEAFDEVEEESVAVDDLSEEAFKSEISTDEPRVEQEPTNSDAEAQESEEDPATADSAEHEPPASDPPVSEAPDEEPKP